jgi:hypothetical protein
MITFPIPQNKTHKKTFHVVFFLQTYLGRVSLSSWHRSGDRVGDDTGGVCSSMIAPHMSKRFSKGKLCKMYEKVQEYVK